MNGDFSKSNGHLTRLKIDPENNFSGVLHQQGRVLLDTDWNAQTTITTHWQDLAGRDVIGPAVAAVPASEPDSVRVRSASVDTSGQVKLRIRPGRLWADGLLVHLPGEEPTPTNPTGDVSRVATYLRPPVQAPPHDPSKIAEGVRDAVILEVWREALNGFQVPDALIEPALGGPDTTERVLTSMRFRLFRLGPQDTCPHIQDDFEKGKLKVSLRPSTTIQGDCPVEEGGGYVGFEHFLYRIEIAQVNAPQDSQPMFKWSQFNGGLVGRGDCDLGGTDKKITITANDQAIKMSGLSSFYLEVVELDNVQGFWRVTYGAKVTLTGDELKVGPEHYTEAGLTGGIPDGTIFFRLWNDIRPIADFPKVAAPAGPNELRDGIRLEFDPAGAANYQPGDYWSFQVRAGEISNPKSLIDDQPPQGVRYHRVPLAILNWNGNKAADFQEIEDCRDVFRPLTNQGVCCSFTVGDGISNHGDFDSIEEALRHLPDTGGEICLLPGLHQANVVIQGKHDIKIKGCDKRTTVVPRGGNQNRLPIFRIVDSQRITLEHMDLTTLDGTAIVLGGTKPGVLKDVVIRDNRILAYENAIRVVQAANVDIRHNNISMLDKEGAGVAVYMMAEDSVIERNSVSVVPAEESPSTDDVPVDVEFSELPTDPCADLEVVYENGPFLVAYVNLLWAFVVIPIPENPFEALGGIQIAGGSERIKLLENRVQGGAGNGITLGSDESAPDGEDPEADEHVVRHNGLALMGRVLAAGSGVEDIALLFVRKSDNHTLSTVTTKNGNFTVGVGKAGLVGDYVVTVTTPGYKIEEIEVPDRLEELPRIFHRIHVVKDETDPRDELAFIYEIQIDRNDISGMGLSGIGIPRVAVPDNFTASSSAASASARTSSGQSREFASIFARLGNPVVNLTIHRNHIFDCLQNPFDRDLRAEARSRGFGGVALGMCGDLSVHENRIENNGTTHINPVCGVYLTYGERIDVAHNEIVDNGPGPTSFNANIEPGKRGGVVLTASSLPGLDFLAGNREAPLRVRPAVRIHDNVVDQPAGQALRITAIGPVSVLGNHLSSELSGPDKLDGLAGAVLIWNLGGMNRVPPRETPPASGIAARANSARAASISRGFVNGNTLFNGNQTSVGSRNRSLTSQLIVSMDDDIGFDGNQSDSLQEGSLVSNTVLLAMTLRASDNRLKEVLNGEQGRRSPMSLLTAAMLLNMTSNNQGDHCIIADRLPDPTGQIPWQVVSENNQVLLPTEQGCEDLGREVHRILRRVRRVLRSLGIMRTIA